MLALCKSAACGYRYLSASTEGALKDLALHSALTGCQNPMKALYKAEGLTMPDEVAEEAKVLQVERKRATTQDNANEWTHRENIRFKHPLEGRGEVTQTFGANKRAYARLGQDGHNGLDIGVAEGTAVRAMHDGVIRFAGNGVGDVLMGAAAGECVLLSSAAYLTGYAHLSRVYVRNGDSVKAGDVLGLVGATGMATGPHLHCELIPRPLALDNGYLGRIDIAPFLKSTGAKLPKTDFAAVRAGAKAEMEAKA